MSEHVASIKSYIAIFVTLLVFTGVTIAVAYVDLGVMNTVVALAIAGFKASLVVLYFMHLKDSHPLSKLFWVAGLLWLAILLTFTMNDYLTRGWQLQPQGWTGSRTIETHDSEQLRTPSEPQP
jgi:cytochrome c oxidase subunit 4